jgi:hypothetical protein
LWVAPFFMPETGFADEVDGISPPTLSGERGTRTAGRPARTPVRRRPATGEPANPPAAASPRRVAVRRPPRIAGYVPFVPSGSRDAARRRWRELVQQELAGERRSNGHGSHRSGVGLGNRAARRRALRAGAPTWNRRPAAPAARPSKRLPHIEQAARTGRKRGTQAARRSQAVAAAPGADGATQPPVALTLQPVRLVACLRVREPEVTCITHGNSNAQRPAPGRRGRATTGTAQSRPQALRQLIGAHARE